MVIFIKIAQFLSSLCLLVLLHEFGHFFFARLFKTRVEKFYLFFNPWFSIFRIKKGETEFGLGWLPLGGYCKISGMIDESMDKEALKQPAQPWEFRSKKPWQRLLIITGGVLMNFILGMLLYMMVLYVWGKEFLPVENAKYGIAVDSLAYDAGFRDGDMILSVDNKKIKSFDVLVKEIVLGDAKTVQVDRKGEKKDIAVPSWLIDKLIKTDKASFITPRFPFEIDTFAEESAGRLAGLLKGDRVIGVDNDTIRYFHEFRNKMQSSKNKKVDVVVVRKNDTAHVSVVVPATGLLGLAPVSLDHYFTFSTQTYTFWQSIPAGINEGFHTLGTYISQFKLMFKHKGYESLGSFITFTRIFPDEWVWQAFFTLTAFLSLILAFMNFLPIPALDGGFIVYILYEMITKKKPSDKFMEYAQMTGMILLLGLLLYATFNDINRFIIK